MQIRVVAHLDCGHKSSGTIEEAQVAEMLTTTDFFCVTCSNWGGTEIRRARGLMTFEELRPLRIA